MPFPSAPTWKGIGGPASPLDPNLKRDRLSCLPPGPQPEERSRRSCPPPAPTRKEIGGRALPLGPIVEGDRWSCLPRPPHSPDLNKDRRSCRLDLGGDRRSCLPPRPKPESTWQASVWVGLTSHNRGWYWLGPDGLEQSLESGSSGQTSSSKGSSWLGPPRRDCESTATTGAIEAITRHSPHTSHPLSGQTAIAIQRL